MVDFQYFRLLFISPENIDINSEMCIDLWQVATVRLINHNVGALKELSCQM